jgi:hypothetical protein
VAAAFVLRFSCASAGCCLACAAHAQAPDPGDLAEGMRL